MPFAQILCNFSPHNAMVFLAVVIPEVTEGKYSMEDDFETAQQRTYQRELETGGRKGEIF